MGWGSRSFTEFTPGNRWVGGAWSFTEFTPGNRWVGGARSFTEFTPGLLLSSPPVIDGWRCSVFY